MKTNISYQESLEILHHLEIQAKGDEKVFFGNCLNRVLSVDIIAKENMPIHPTSAMDGYAFNINDLEHLLGDGLELAAINKAGEHQELECPQIGCIKTFTGSRMPRNCDALVLREYVQEVDGKVSLLSSSPIPQAHQWIRQVGENYKKGEVLLYKGSKITAFEIGLLADLNHVFIQVARRPKIAILSGGDEIIEVGEEKRENTIRSVNNHLLKAIATSWGAEAVIFPLLRDDRESIRAQILNALADCDILVTTGGASHGDFDFVQEILQELCDVRFRGVRMKPGKAVGFGIYQDKSYVFALPGFPNSCAVGFMLFVRTLVQKMLSMPTQSIPFCKAVLLEDIKRSDGRVEFRICDVRIGESGGYEVGFWNKTTLQSSVINNFCNSSALIFLEENGKDLQKGEKVEIILLEKLLTL